jgi:non-homologous end joining protein Ku
MVALGRVVFTSREHMIALEPRGKGLLGITLRYPYEVRKEEEYFEDIPDEKIPKGMLELASHIVETTSGISTLRNLRITTKMRSAKRGNGAWLGSKTTSCIRKGAGQ